MTSRQYLKTLKDGSIFYIHLRAGSFVEKWRIEGDKATFIKDSFSPRDKEPSVSLDSTFWDKRVIVEPDTPVYVLSIRREVYHYIDKDAFDKTVDSHLKDYRICIIRPVTTIEGLFT